MDAPSTPDEPATDGPGTSGVRRSRRGRGGDKPVRPLIAGLQERRERHKQRNPIVRVVYVAAAVTVVVAGIAMLLLPGPAFIVIPIGLTMLALEFASAERLLDRALDQADAAKQKASDTSPVQRALMLTAVGLAVAAAVAAVIYWHINVPVVPWF